MTRSYWYIEAPGDGSDVLDWFAGLPHPPEQVRTATGFALHFRRAGPLMFKQDGALDVERSPLVTLVLPTVRRTVLWTTGSVHFLPIPISQFPDIARINKLFAQWMAAYPLAHDPKLLAENRHSYYLEGSAPNRGPITALPSGAAALSEGQFFVDALDNDGVLDRVCRTLRLRGINCA